MTVDKPHTVKVNEYVKMAYISLGIDMVMKATADLIHVRSQTGFCQSHPRSSWRMRIYSLRYHSHITEKHAAIRERRGCSSRGVAWTYSVDAVVAMASLADITAWQKRRPELTR
jgi:hypothetical protein